MSYPKQPLTPQPPAQLNTQTNMHCHPCTFSTPQHDKYCHCLNCSRQSAAWAGCITAAISSPALLASIMPPTGAYIPLAGTCMLAGGLVGGCLCENHTNCGCTSPEQDQQPLWATQPAPVD
jgi:hypothetical protein